MHPVVVKVTSFQSVAELERPEYHLYSKLFPCALSSAGTARRDEVEDGWAPMDLPSMCPARSEAGDDVLVGIN